MFWALSFSSIKIVVGMCLQITRLRRPLNHSGFFFSILSPLPPSLHSLTSSPVLLSPSPGLVEEAVSSPTFVLASSLFWLLPAHASAPSRHPHSSSLHDNRDCHRLIWQLILTARGKEILMNSRDWDWLRLIRRFWWNPAIQNYKTPSPKR